MLSAIISKRNAVLVLLAVCLLVFLHTDDSFLGRLRARHVRVTVLLSAGNLELAGFFDGLTPHPHWNAAKALRAAREAHSCGNRGGGLLTRIAGLFERTAYAQSCGTDCGGNWGSVSDQSCGANCTDIWIAGQNGPDFCTGNYQSSTVGCSGSGCSNDCNNSTCLTSGCGGTGGGCTQNGHDCEADIDCCSGWCDFTVFGVCMSTF